MRSNLILAVIAAALAFFTVYTWKTQRVEFTNYDEIPRLFEGFTPSNVAAIVVSAPETDDEGERVTGEDGKIKREALQFASRDGKWFLQNTEISGAIVRGDRIRDNVLDQLQRIRRDDMALIKESASNEDLETYGLTEDESILVQCYDAGGNPLTGAVTSIPVRGPGTTPVDANRTMSQIECAHQPAYSIVNVDGGLRRFPKLVRHPRLRIERIRIVWQKPRVFGNFIRHEVRKLNH